MRLSQLLLFLCVIFFMPAQLVAGMQPITFEDSAGKEISITEPPTRVVSLVPSVTEMLLRIGAEHSLSGLTYQTVLPPVPEGKKIIGGFFSPDADRVAALNPDLIFYSSLHKEIVQRFEGKVLLVTLSPRSIQDSFSHIRLLGRIFQRQTEAEAVIAEEERSLAVIAAKVKKIPEDKRKRVIRFMGRNKVMTPGDDSFQNDFIRAAGAIAPEFGKKGNVIELDLKEWQDFNPQIIYGCGMDKDAFTILDKPGWNSVDAIQDNKKMSFPCQLTCRASTHSGYFVSWLASSIYGAEFSDPSQHVLPEKIVSRKKIAVDLDFLNTAEVLESDIRDFRNKTLAISLKEPMTTLSTLEGWRNDISTVANHYFPPPSWGLGHEHGLDALRQHTQKVLRFDPAETTMLFTGANMDNLAVIKKSYRDLTVYALVTAGVEGNAVKMAKDTGSFYEPDKPGKQKKPGTINVVLLTNAHLSARAMTRAIISATEAKSAALADLDIRSSYSAPTNQATGTGTDNVLVVEGRGIAIENCGGHTKMGELIARAVYDGVHEAIRKQNGLTVKRTIFKRLKERGISLWDIAKDVAPEGHSGKVHGDMERILMQPRVTSFMKAAFAISDDYQRGLIKDLSSFDSWCQAMADSIAAKKVDLKAAQISIKLPEVLKKSLTAVANGVLAKIDSYPTVTTKKSCETSCQ